MTIDAGLLTPVSWVSFGIGQPLAALNTTEMWKINVPRSIRVCVENHASLLSNEEKQQAARFKRPEDHARFVVARVSLKIILGKYLNLQPEDIHISRKGNGKPYAEGPVQFNVSHSGDWALVACGLSPVGVDVEKVQEGFNYRDIAFASFGSSEMSFVENAADRLRTFYCLWTRKEAHVKRLGLGLVENLAEINILSPGLLMSFTPGSEYIAALSAITNPLTGINRELIFS